MKTTPVPEGEPCADLRLKLDQLNRLEEEGATTRRSGHSALDSEALIESLRANIPLNVLLQHDRLRARGRKSVAEVRHGVCSGCHMSLPSGTQLEVKREAAIVKCDYCGRFIFVVEDESAPSAKPSRWRSRPADAPANAEARPAQRRSGDWPRSGSFHIIPSR